MPTFKGKVKMPKWNAKGYIFTAIIRKRGQITIDASIIKSLNLKEGEPYQFLLVAGDEEDE